MVEWDAAKKWSDGGGDEEALLLPKIAGLQGGEPKTWRWKGDILVLIWKNHQQNFLIWKNHKRGQA
jgi:hypothetical protein